MPGPRRLRSSLDILAACLAAATLTACSDSGNRSGGSGTGGTPTAANTGGSAAGGGTSAGGSDGVMATGGAGVSGGVTATGGAGVSGGSTAAGSSNGGGGVSATGGITSTGGATTTGGSIATGGSHAGGGTTDTGGSYGTGGSTDTGGGSTTTSGSSGSDGFATTGGSAGAGGAEGGSVGDGGAGSGGSDATGGAADTCPPATPLTGGTEYCWNHKDDAGHGYSFELWASEGGEGCMTVRGIDANFSATWSNVDDFLARVGLDFDRTRTPAQIGNISAEFAETKTGDTGLVYVGIYGWTVDPLREYYILDDWGTTQPADTASDGTPRDHAGTITVDGDTYEVWTHTQVDKPAITGDSETFDQYFSVRQTARQCGHVSISEHFVEWTRLGLDLGNLVEAKLLVEAQHGSGTIDFTTATVVVE